MVVVQIQGWFYNLFKAISNLQYDAAKVLENGGYVFSFFGQWTTTFPFPRFRKRKSNPSPPPPSNRYQ